SFFLSSRLDHFFSTFVFLFFLSHIPPLLITLLFPFSTLFRSDKGRISSMFLPSGRTFSSVINLLTSVFTRSSNVIYMTNIVFIRSEEHTSELQSRFDLVCRLLLEKKNYFYNYFIVIINNFSTT